MSFNARIGLDFKMRCESPDEQIESANPFEVVVHDTDMKQDASPQLCLNPSLYYNQTGEASVLDWKESCVEFGL